MAGIYTEEQNNNEYIADPNKRLTASLTVAVNSGGSLPENFWDNLIYDLENGNITCDQALLLRFGVNPFSLDALKESVKSNI